MHAGDEFEEGSVEIARIEVVRAIDPRGAMVWDWIAVGPDGKALDEVTILGLLERAKLDIHESRHEKEDR